MRVVIQRVRAAAVAVAGETVGKIGPGLLVLAGFEEADDEADLAWMAGKIVRTRIMADDSGVMNRSVLDADGEILAVSQFGLRGAGRHAATCRSRYSSASSPAYRPNWASRCQRAFSARTCRSVWSMTGR